MACSCEGICIQESAQCRIVITGLEVIEAGLSVVDIASVAQGVVGSQGAGHGTADGKGLAPGIVGVGDHGRSGGVQDRGDIALEVGGVVVSSAVVGDRQRCTAGIVSKVQRIPVNSHLAQLAAVVDIAICRAAAGPGGPHAIRIIGKGPGLPGKLDLAGFGIDHIAGAVGDSAAVAVSAVAVRYRYPHGSSAVPTGCGITPGAATIGAHLPHGVFTD